MTSRELKRLSVRRGEFEAGTCFGIRVQGVRPRVCAWPFCGVVLERPVRAVWVLRIPKAYEAPMPPRPRRTVCDLDGMSLLKFDSVVATILVTDVRNLHLCANRLWVARWNCERFCFQWFKSENRAREQALV